jgi:uncharacterized protein
MTTLPKARGQSTLTAAEIATWLEQHPDFFTGRDSLVMKMVLPHAHSTNNGEAISLVERQVSLLRERNRQSRGQLDALLAAAKRNDAIYQKCQRLILALIEAKDSNSFFKALEASFKREFKSDAYSLIIFSEYAHQINHYTSSISIAAATEYVGALMDRKEPFLGVLRTEEQDFLFRHASATVRSAAVLQVRNRKQIALLSIGSADADYFKAEMGTLFIGFVADVLGRLLPRYVYLDPR